MGSQDGRSNEQDQQSAGEGAVGPVRGGLSPRVEGARLYGAVGGQPTAAGGPVQRLAPGGQLSVSELSAGRVEEFLGWQRAGGRHRSQWSRPGLVCLLGVLRELGVLAAGEPVRAASPAEVLLAGFRRYLTAERGLAAGTVRGYVSHARRFLSPRRRASQYVALQPRRDDRSTWTFLVFDASQMGCPGVGEDHPHGLQRVIVADSSR